MDAETSNDLRPPLTFRVGVTGHRHLAPELVEGLQAEIGARLAQVKAAIEACAATPEAAAIYARDADDVVRAHLRVVSPLAEGADRLVAREGKKLGAELNVPLPFPQTQYENDFPPTVDDFRRLLDGSRAFTLDGVRDDSAAQSESYQAVGQFVARNSDLLIAVWDGQRERGAGGTAEIVVFAVEIGTPVWWIHATGRLPPRLISGAREATGEAAIAALERLIKRALLPPRAPRAHEEPIAAAIDWAGRGFQPETSPLETFFGETPRPARWPWRLYQGMLAFMAPARSKPARALATATSEEEHYWRRRFEAADRASAAYADRYRSSYVWIALLAVVALVAAAFAVEIPGGHGFRAAASALEALALLWILALVVANHVRHWHERWISYRLLAELCRKQFALSPIGRALPGSEVAHLAFDSQEARRTQRDAWVAWYFLASLRGAAFPQGDMATAAARALDIGRSLIDEQVDFHRARRRAMRGLALKIDVAAYVLFFATLAIAMFKIGLIVIRPERELALWDLVGALLSAGAGSLVALRAYSEFALLARQSAFMMRVLSSARKNLKAAAPGVGEPLGSRALARALDQTTTAMMQDITGWAHLFRIKTIAAS